MSRKPPGSARRQNAANFATVRLRLFRLARSAMKRAYAPYSKFRVGAAVLLRDGRSLPVATWRCLLRLDHLR